MSKTYDPQTAALIARIATAMPAGMTAQEMQHWIESPRALKHTLQIALCRPQNMFPTWVSIEIGNLENGNTALTRLRQSNTQISKSVGDTLLCDLTYEKTSNLFDLARVSVEDLGLPGGVKTTTIFKQARVLGLQLCPHETIVQYWLTKPNRDNLDEWSHIALESPVIKRGLKHTFTLNPFDDMTQIEWSYDDERTWGADSLWVFVKQRHF